MTATTPVQPIARSTAQPPRAPAPAGKPAGRGMRAWLVVQGLVYIPTGVLLMIQAVRPTDPAVANELTHGLVAHPFLRLLLAVGSAVIFAIGLVMTVNGFRHSRQRALPDAPLRLRHSVGWVGTVGSVGRGLTFLLAGAVGLLEAATSSPARAGAVVGAVRTFWQQPYGRPVLFVLAAALVLFGVYELAAAAYRPSPPREQPGAATSPRRTLGGSPGAATVTLLAAAIGLYLIAFGVGWVLVHNHLPRLVAQVDAGVSAWFADHRMPALDWLTGTGSGLADTATVIAVTAVVFFGLRVWLGRWRESAAVAVAVVGELTIFLAVTSTIHRVRPLVPHLDVSPPTSSFPSGHTGAAVALYCFLAVVALRYVTPRRFALALAWAGFAVPVVVGLSRIYRGMHYLTDVLAGAVVSGVWLAAVLAVLMPRPHEAEHDEDVTAMPVPVAS